MLIIITLIIRSKGLLTKNAAKGLEQRDNTHDKDNGAITKGEGDRKRVFAQTL